MALSKYLLMHFLTRVLPTPFALGISGIEDELILSTLTSSKSHRGCTFSFSDSSLTEDEVYDLPNVVSIETYL